MDNFYELGLAGKRPVLIIRRKPSQIPFSIDLELTRLAGMATLDGPNNRVTYEFLIPTRIVLAETFLLRCGWKKVSDEIDSLVRMELDKADFDRPDHK